MEVNILSTDMEKQAVIDAICRLNSIRHINYMSHAALAECSGLKDTKVRYVLSDLVNEGSIIQIPIPGARKVDRYYYVLTVAGKQKYSVE